MTILIFLGGSGSLDIEFAYTFEGVDDPSNTYSELYWLVDMLVRVKNNPADSYFWDGKQGKFVWNWTSGTTGLLLGPMLHIFAGNRFSFQFTVTCHC